MEGLRRSVENVNLVDYFKVNIELCVMNVTVLCLIVLCIPYTIFLVYSNCDSLYDASRVIAASIIILIRENVLKEKNLL